MVGIFKETNVQKVICLYSCVSIKWAGSNKQAGPKFCKKLINEQALISEQGGILIKVSKASRLFKQYIG